MKLLLDEMLDAAIARELRRRGYDVDAVTERYELRHKPDAFLFEVALAEGRSIVTENVADFRILARDHLARGSSHCGLVLMAARRMHRGDARFVARMVSALGSLLAIDIDLTNLEYWLS